MAETIQQKRYETSQILTEQHIKKSIKQEPRQLMTDAKVNQQIQTKLPPYLK